MAEPIEVATVPSPKEVAAAARETWIAGSIPQLRLKWSGRCVTCQSWTEPTGKAKQGTCSWFGSKDAKSLISGVGDGPILTAPGWGCHGWSEIVPEMTPVEREVKRGGRVELEVEHKELSGPIRARTEHAIAAGLMKDVPDEKRT